MEQKCRYQTEVFSSLVHALFSKIQKGTTCILRVPGAPQLYRVECSTRNFACELYDDETIVAISLFIVSATTSRGSTAACRKIRLYRKADEIHVTFTIIFSSFYRWLALKHKGRRGEKCCYKSLCTLFNTRKCINNIFCADWNMRVYNEMKNIFFRKFAFCSSNNDAI